jgi:flagellar basal-body rod protein FlgB
LRIGIDNALGIHPEALQLRSQRTEVLARNIANADTPGFKSRDLDFRAVLAAQTSKSSGGPQAPLQRTHSQHMQDSTIQSHAADLGYRIPLMPSLDGNTVESQVEQAEFAENALQFQASLRFLNGKFTGLMTAIRGE